jgi:predicted MFS family arabinose efflux permease
LIVVVSVNGFFNIGVFVVALPLLARDIYFDDVSFYSLLYCSFVLGSALVTVLVVFRGNFDAPGRRIVFSLLYSGLILIGLSAGPTQYGTMFLIFLWGVVVGISAILGRTILQSQVPADYRGRVISVYQLMLFGFAPLGSLMAGFAIEYWGVLYVLKLSAIASFAAFAAMFLTRALWDLKEEDAQAIINPNK